jgi:hypothetical protein
MGRPFKCPYCGHSESVSKGVRKTKSMGDRQIRLCKSCHRKFTPKNQKPAEAGPSSAPPAQEATPTAPVTGAGAGLAQGQAETASLQEAEAAKCPMPKTDQAS